MIILCSIFSPRYVILKIFYFIVLVTLTQAPTVVPKDGFYIFVYSTRCQRLPFSLTYIFYYLRNISTFVGITFGIQISHLLTRSRLAQHEHRAVSLSTVLRAPDALLFHFIPRFLSKFRSLNVF